MNTKTFWAFVGIIIIAFSSCRKDFEYDTISSKLRFSKDTLLLDTVFNQVRSETYAVKVYNNENKDIVIPSIKLRNGASSYYKINVDGQSNDANTFENIPLRAKDSLYVFVEIAPSINPPNTALVEEDLVFQSIQEQVVKLVSLVEDAEFFYPQSGQTTIPITTSQTWTNQKSKVIYGNLLFTNQSRLTIQAGTRVYFHKDSRLTIDENSELYINGTMANPVVIRGDRHDPYYDNLPNNWEGIHLVKRTDNTKHSVINYAIIKGGIIGLQADENVDLSLINTKILNHTLVGLYSINAIINGYNNVFNNTSEASFKIEKGGTYNFKHCTFGNYWEINSFPGSVYALSMSNEFDNNGTTETAPLNATFGNCIFYTRSVSSIAFFKNTAASYNYTFTNTLLKLGSSSNINPATDTNFVNYKLNEDPKFYNSKPEANDFTLKTDSPAKGYGNTAIAASVQYDLRGVSRVTNPSVGAFQ